MAKSAVRVDLQMDDGGLQSGWSPILDESEWRESRQAILRALGEDLVGNMKREVPVNTGRLRGTIRMLETANPDRANVVAGGQQGVDYALPVLHGTEPHPPGSSNPEANRSLARWARRNNYSGGFEGIYWSIARYGTEAHDYVSEPLEQTQREAAGIAETVLRQRGVY